MEMIGDEPKKEISLKTFEFPEDMRIIIPKRKLKKIIDKRAINVKEMAKINGSGSKSIYHYLNGKRNPTLSFIKKVVDDKLLHKLLKTNRVKFGHGGNAATAIFPSQLTPKLAYLIGALRDGTINFNGKYELCYVQKNIQWLKILSRLILQIFHPSNKPRIIVRKGYTPKMTVNNRVICEFLKIVFNIPIGRKEEWGTPDIILKSPKEIQRYYVRGYFDADGICGKHIGFCQVNLQSLKDLRHILKKFNIKCTNTISSRKLKSGKIFYSLYIQKKYWNSFFKKIGSSYPSKFTRFVQN